MNVEVRCSPNLLQSQSKKNAEHASMRVSPNCEHAPRDYQGKGSLCSEVNCMHIMTASNQSFVVTPEGAASQIQTMVL